jgi:dTMP kinase
MKIREGLFITFEGGEGAGKTTLIHCIAHQLAAQGYEMVKTREPGSTHLGEQIRELLLHSPDPIVPKAELFLFLAARVQHIQEVILPALATGKIVLCDRFNDSTIAYQGIARELGMSRVAELCTYACDELKPHRTFYLDLDPNIGLMRAKQEHLIDRFESEGLEFHQRLRQAFLDLQQREPERIRLLDASLSAEVVCAEAMQYIKLLL